MSTLLLAASAAAASTSVNEQSYAAPVAGFVWAAMNAAVAAVAGGFAAASCCAACDSPNRSSGVFRRATKNTSASAWDISPPSGITGDDCHAGGRQGMRQLLSLRREAGEGNPYPNTAR